MSNAYISVVPIADSTPGFSFGRSGIVNAGTYLQVDSVPSNLAGRIVPFDTSSLNRIFIVCQSESTFDIEVQKRNGLSFTTLYTASVVNARVMTEEVENVEFALGDELAVRLSSGSCSNLIVGLIIRGS